MSQPKAATASGKVVSIIVPIFNEQATVERIIQKIHDVDLSALGLKKEIIIVDDGSTDTTPDILRQIHHQENGMDVTRIFFNRLNLGKGTTIRVGLKYARGQYILIQDADLEYDPQDYPAILAPLLRGEARVVLGSRFQRWARHPRYPLSHFLGTKFLTLVTNVLYQAGISDEASCYKAATSEVFKSLNLKCREFEFCPEFIAKVRKKGLKIHEVPVHFFPRTLLEGKKVSWKDGWHALTTLLRYRFVD